MALPIRIGAMIAAFVAIFAVAGCQSQSPPSRSESDVSRGDQGARRESKAEPAATPKFAFDKDDTTFLAEVAKAIPIGTPIVEAERILKANDFKCRRFDDVDGKRGLRGEHAKPIGFLVSWVWVVWLIEEDGKVSGINGSTAGLGP